MWRHFARVAGIAVLSVAGLSSQAGAGILAPGGTYAGRTYNEWQVLWWQTAMSTPVVGGDHPVFSGGVLGERDGVAMLTGVFGVATVNLTLSSNTALFFPILNVESSVFEAPPFHGDDEASLQANSVALLDQTSGVFASIDGSSVDVTSYRFVSPLFSWGPLPADNILGAPEGTTSDAADAGYYLLLTPFSVGTHTIHFGGTFGGPVSGSIDTTYVITVIPEPGSLTLLAIGILGSIACRVRKDLAVTSQ